LLHKRRVLSHRFHDVDSDGTMALCELLSSFDLAIDGNLYLHDNASLDVTTIAQGATGQIEYFLTSNESQHGAIGVGSAVSNTELAGEVAVYLDGESFADSKFAAVC
jgi:hypothetical protein